MTPSPELRKAFEEKFNQFRYKHHDLWWIDRSPEEDFLSFIAEREDLAIERRDGELIIMMDEIDNKGWTLKRFLATFCVLYQNKYGNHPTTH